MLLIVSVALTPPKMSMRYSTIIGKKGVGVEMEYLIETLHVMKSYDSYRLHVLCGGLGCRDIHDVESATLTKTWKCFFPHVKQNVW